MQVCKLNQHKSICAVLVLYLAIQIVRSIFVGPLWWTDEAYHLSSGAHFLMGIAGIEPIMPADQLFWYAPLWRIQCGVTMALGGWWEVVRIENVIMAATMGVVLYKLLLRWDANKHIAAIGAGIALFVPSSFYWAGVVQDYAGSALLFSLWVLLLSEKKLYSLFMIAAVAFLYREQMFVLIPLSLIAMVYFKKFQVMGWCLIPAVPLTAFWLLMRAATNHYPVAVGDLLYYVKALPLQLGLPLLAGVVGASIYLWRVGKVSRVIYLWGLWGVWQLPVLVTHQEGRYVLPAVVMLSLLVPLALSSWLQQRH